MVDSGSGYDKCTFPLISYVLICFNQREFIAEAANSALSQDYPNLEVIISDDCSSDGTFDIANDVVHRSRTAKTVLVRQTSKNLGLIGNFKDACRLATGDLIVIAAGDDVSLPIRTSEIARTWIRDGSSIVHSDYEIIDSEGRVIPSNDKSRNRFRYDASSLFNRVPAYGFAGATAAYTKRIVLDADIPLDSGAEDVVMMFYALANGLTISQVDKKLVLYRSHALSMSHIPQSSVLQSEIDHISSIKRGTKSLRYLLDIYHGADGGDIAGRIDVYRLSREIAHHEFRENWMSVGIVCRLKEYLACRSKAYRRWIAPRVFGIRILLIAKGVSGYFRRRFWVKRD